MARDDPFTGIRLSEQAEPQKIEQRLFTTNSPKDPSDHRPPDPPLEAPTALPKDKSAPVPIKRLQLPKSATIARSRFDLDDEPWRKASYLYTDEELEALEDLKTELRREQDTKVSKNTLVRCALHMLIEDYATRGGDSYASRKITGTKRAGGVAM